MLQDEAAGCEGICSAMTEILASRSCGWAVTIVAGRSGMLVDGCVVCLPLLVRADVDLE